MLKSKKGMAFEVKGYLEKAKIDRSIDDILTELDIALRINDFEPLKPNKRHDSTVFKHKTGEFFALELLQVRHQFTGDLLGVLVVVTPINDIDKEDCLHYVICEYDFIRRSSRVRIIENLDVCLYVVNNDDNNIAGTERIICKVGM